MGISPMVWYNRKITMSRLTGTKDVPFIIVQIPRAQASALAEVKGQDDEERPDQKIRLE